MKLLIAILLVSQVGLAKPLERNAVTKAHKKQLEPMLGSSNEKLLKTQFPGAKREVFPDRATDTYLFERDESCVWTYYFNKKGIVTDLEVSSEACFGPHKTREDRTPSSVLVEENSNKDMINYIRSENVKRFGRPSYQ